MDQIQQDGLKRTFQRAAAYHPSFFAAEIGIDAKAYRQGAASEHAAVDFLPEQGWIHGVHALVTPKPEGGVSVAVDHWVHGPDNKNILTRFLELDATEELDENEEKVIVIKRVTLQGKDLDISDRKTLSAAVKTCQQIVEQLRHKGPMPALNSVAERNGLKTRILPSTYKDGSVRARYETGKTQTRQFLRVPEKFLPALTSFFEEGVTATEDAPAIFDATLHDSATRRDYALSAKMTRNMGAEKQTDISLRLARRNNDAGENEEPYTIQRMGRLVFKPCYKEKNQGLVELQSAEIAGRTMKLSRHRDAVRAVNFIHEAVKQARVGEMPDMGHILKYTDLQHAISGVPTLEKEEGARYTYRVLGGNPSGPRLFKEDNGIGANCFVHTYEWHDEEGGYKSQTIMEDCGIGPLNRDKTGFDAMIAHAGQYLAHRTNEKHNPKHKIDALFVTHHHIDHFEGIPHLLLAGYVVPRIVCNAATKMAIEKACKALDVPREHMPAEWTVIDPVSYALRPIIRALNDTPALKDLARLRGSPRLLTDDHRADIEDSFDACIEKGCAKLNLSTLKDEERAVIKQALAQYIDNIRDRVEDAANPDNCLPEGWKKEDGEKEFTIGKFHLTTGPIAHSAITNWVSVKTPEGSVLHYSDGKADQSIGSHEPANIERLSALKPTVAVVDSTHADDEDATKSEKELEEEIVEFLNQHPDKGAMAFQIGSNAARLVTINNAYGRTGRSTVVFGAALRFLKSVMEAVGVRDGSALKSYLKKTFGTTIVNYTANAKAANALINDPAHFGGLATGTHNEPMSIANRLIDNLDRKNLGFVDPSKHVIILSQTAIPGNARKWEELRQWLERRGFAYKIVHASGHEGKKGIEKMLDWAAAPYGVATHGDNRQRAAAAAIITEKGMTPINPTEQDVIQISDKKGCRIIAQEPSTMVYYKIIRPKTQHYGGGADVEYLTHDVEPEMRTQAGEMITEINRIKKAQMPAAEKKLTAHWNKTSATGGDNLIFRNRVDISLPDYLIKNGLMRRVIYDCETTQLGHEASVTQFAAIQADWADETQRKSINIRQTLAPTILPNLDAMLATRTLPSSLYETGDNKYPLRQFYFEVKKFLNESHDYYGHKRIFVERSQKPDDPSQSKVARKDSAYRETSLKFALTGDELKDPKYINVKTSGGGFNNIRADDPWLAHLAFRAGASVYSPVTSGGMRRFDIRSMARAFAYLRPDKFKATKKPDGFMDFSLQGLIKSNKLTYDAANAHDALADVVMEEKLLKFMLDADAELFTKMMLNTDAEEVKTFLTGAHNGMDRARCLMTYVNDKPRDAKANIGVYVGRSTDERHFKKALVFNVSDFNPIDFKDMSADQLAAIMNDPQHPCHSAFEIIDIGKQPILASGDRGMAVGANRGASIETMKTYKHFIEENAGFAARLISAMEKAKYRPEPEPGSPLEQRIYTTPLMKMSKNDREIMKLFDPVADEFTDKKFAHDLNRARAVGLDRMRSAQARERGVAILYQIEREYKDRFGVERSYLHKDDRDRERAKEKARIHGVFKTGDMSIGLLKMQVEKARAEWETRMKGKTADERLLSEQILKQCEDIVADITTKIAAGDPDWAMTAHDYELLGLNDNVPNVRYQRPLAKNPVRAPKLG